MAGHLNRDRGGGQRKTPNLAVILSEAALRPSRRTHTVRAAPTPLRGILTRIRENAFQVYRHPQDRGDPSTRAFALAQDDNGYGYSEKTRPAEGGWSPPLQAGNRKLETASYLAARAPVSTRRRLFLSSISRAALCAMCSALTSNSLISSQGAPDSPKRSFTPMAPVITGTP